MSNAKTAGMSRKTMGKIALLMAGILAFSAVITLFTGVSHKKEADLRVVTSFYPVYVAALNLTDGVEGVAVESLTQPQTGCLHDFQLSPENMIALTGADLLLINGAGAESFLDQVVAQLPELPIVDASAGIELLPAGHEHDHGGEPEDEDEHAFYNEHIWASPQRYRRQVENLRDGLMRLDPAHAAAYEANAAAYLARVSEVEDRLRRAVEAAPTKICITFHDSLQYFARDLGLTPAAALTIGEEAGVSAADLAAAQQAATAARKVLLLYDSQYPVEYAYVGEGASWCRTLDLDMGVAGEADKDAWLRAMEGNALALEAAFA